MASVYQPVHPPTSAAHSQTLPPEAYPPDIAVDPMPLQPMGMNGMPPKPIKLPSTERLPVGTAVLLRSDSRYFNQSNGNLGIILDRSPDSGFDYVIMWGNGKKAYYRIQDVDKADGEIRPIFKVGTTVKRGQYDDIRVITHVGPERSISSEYDVLIGIRRHRETDYGSSHSEINWSTVEGFSSDYTVVKEPETKCPPVLICTECPTPCAIEARRRHIEATKKAREEEERRLRAEREAQAEKEKEKLKRTISVSKQVIDFMEQDANEHHVGGYTNPMQYLLGANKDGVIIGLVPVVGRGGCKDGAYISPKQFSLGIIQLTRRKLTPMGMGKVGVFSRTCTQGVDEVSKNDPNAVMLQYTYYTSDTTRRWACLSYNYQWAVLVEHNIKVVKIKNRKGVI